MRLAWMLVLLAFVTVSASRGQDSDETLSDRWSRYWEKKEEDEKDKKRLVGVGVAFQYGLPNDIMNDRYGGMLWLEYRRWLPVVIYGSGGPRWMKAKWEVLPEGWIETWSAEIGWLLQYQYGRLAPYGGLGLGLLNVSKRSEGYIYRDSPFGPSARVEEYDLGTDFLTGILHLGACLKFADRFALWTDLSYLLAEPSIELVYVNVTTHQTWRQTDNYDMSTLMLAIGLKSAL